MLEEQSPCDDPYARQETFVLTLFRLFKLATMHDLSNQAIGRGLSHAAQTFGEIFARESTDLSALFTTENVFINGQPLKASRGTYESVLELGRLLERTGFNELRLGRAVSRDDLAQMLEHFVLFRKDPPGNRSVQLTRNVRFKHVDPTFILGDNEGELTIEERVARIYTSALVIMRRALEALAEGEYRLMNTIKRVAQELGGKSANIILPDADMAKAVAAEWRLPLVRLDPGALFQKYFGESERNMRKAIATAEAMAPVVLWIDEIEKALGQGDNDGGTSSRVFGSFLAWLQEKKESVFVIATANDIPTDELARYQGQPIDAFYAAFVCGGHRLRVGGAGPTREIDAPLAFQSALAGVLLAAEIVADAGGLRSADTPTLTRADVLSTPGVFESDTEPKGLQGRCICRDDDFRARYAEKYEVQLR